MCRFAGLSAAILFGLGAAIPQEAHSQTRNTVASIALKGGESVEVSNLFAVANCRSTLTATPTAEVMEGPSEVTVSVKEAMVVPRAQECNKPVKGAKLVLTAKNIDDYSTSKLTVRIHFKTKDGETQRSLSYNLNLFPNE